jgi:DNA-binding NtrC family response regulator
MAGTVLIVDDEVQLVRHLEYLLKSEGYQVAGVHDGASARQAVESIFPDVVLVDLKLPDTDGTTLMTELLRRHPTVGFIIITAYGSIRSAVEATKRGARDYLTKPFEPDELLVAVRNVIRDRIREEEIAVLRKRGRVSQRPGVAQDRPTEDPAQYRSPVMQETLRQAEQAAASDSIVLLLGESGSGKDYLARLIHDRSRRANGPFFAVNCAAVAPELAESELFGHEPGAFTGARGRKRGLLELAEGGTLLLNEIGELSLPMQAKLLTFLDTRSFTRVGGEANIQVNARLIAATNRELERETHEGRFRSDLFYRLNVLSICIPPLRERIEDLPLLVRQVVSRLATELAFTEIPQPDNQTLDVLASYHWPGNVRELRNVLERGIMLSGSGRLDLSGLKTVGDRKDWSYTVTFPGGKTIHDVTKEMKRSLVLEALRRANGSKQIAARMLGISRHAFAHQMKAAGLDD